MMRINDAALLAYTKLRTRKVRLFVTIFISGILLSVLTTGSFVMRGAFKSAEDFNKEGLGSRFLIQGQPIDVAYQFDSPEILARAEQLYKESVAIKKAEAKRLGIDYDSKTDSPPYAEYDGRSGKVKQLLPDTPIGSQVVTEYLKKNPTPGITEMKKLAEPYGASQYLDVWPRSVGAYNTPALKILVDGKEKYESDQQNQNFQFGSTGLDAFVDNWALVSDDLLKPFLIPGATLAANDGRIPIVAPFTAVQELAGFKPLPKTATPKDRVERIKQVREKAKDITFQACYRNAQSTSEVSDTIIQKQQIEQNKNNKDYTKPSVIFDLPLSPCTAPQITKDTRTTDEKKLQQKQLEFDRLFGKQVPESGITTFKIVGVSPDPPDYNASTVDQIIFSILGSNLGSSWFTPMSLHSSQGLLQKIFVENSVNYGPSRVAIAEFQNPAQAQLFMEKAQCSTAFGGIGGPAGVSPGSTCKQEAKHFYLSPYGSSSIALDSAKKGFAKIFTIAAFVVAAIAGVIMIGTIGRIIADSRRETAVFRAIGAKRLDIAQIYITYTLYLTCLIFIFALVTGLTMSLLANNSWSDQLTAKALIAFNAQDLTRQFRLFMFEWRDIGLLLLLTIGAGVTSSALPLLTNIRRNPIRDMRDEN